MTHPAADLSGAVWRKASRSASNGGQCVEVASNLPGPIAIRDSKDPDGAVLLVGRARWRAFLSTLSED